MRVLPFLSILLSPFILLACGGSDGESGANSSSGTISIGLSDSPVNDVTKVNIVVDSITLNREGEDDIVIDTFTSKELDLVDADTFELDLLEVQGNDNRIVLDSLEVPAGTYQNLRLGIIDGDVNTSFVIDAEGSKPIKQPSGELKLGGFTVEAGGVQTFIIEFDLRKSMTYNPGPDRYILKPRGVRIVELAKASSIAGSVDPVSFNSAPPCDAKVDPLLGNVMYLYSGHGLDAASLGDVYDIEVTQNIVVPEGTVEPYSAATVAEDGSFVFSYVEPGDYTLAFSCAAGQDDPEQYEALTIPSPETDFVEVSVQMDQSLTCTFPELSCQ